MVVPWDSPDDSRTGVNIWSAKLHVHYLRTQITRTTEAFAAALGRHLEQWLALQAPVRRATAEMSEVALAAAGMPSRAEVTGIARRISELDDRLEGLEDKLGVVIARLEALTALTSRGTASAQGTRPATQRPRRKKRE